MTHEQRIAEIRELLGLYGLWAISSEDRRKCNQALQSLDTLAAECLRLREDNRNGKWIDVFGACRVCGGEIPHGHSEHCDYYALEKEVRELRKLKLFRVSVLQEVEASAHEYSVLASTDNDALQLAFALDGGWSDERNAEEMLELAKSYACIISAPQALDAAKEAK